MSEPEASGPALTGFPATAPADVHNRALVAALRPAEWEPPEPALRYDLVVLGGGAAGLVAALGAAGVGAKVALVERGLLGGDCLNTGCVPSKALLRCARALADVKEAGAFGVQIEGEVRVDFPAIMERMRALRAELAPHDSAERLREAGVDLFFGKPAFLNGRTVQVLGAALREDRLNFQRACLATGARPALPEIPGLAEAEPLTSETVFSLVELPPRLAILGAGPIGCELAQAFARFGSEVTLLDTASRVLPREDEAASALIATALERAGVRLVLGAALSEVRREGTERVLVEAQGEVRTDALLVATGRRANTEELGLEVVGVKHSPQGVEVDDRLRTSHPSIYACGDVCLQTKFTHMAAASAKLVIRNALFFGRRRLSKLVVPWCTYTDPEVAHVGITEAEASARGEAVQSFEVPLAQNDRALLEGEREGYLRVWVQARSGRLLGATLVSRQAGESLAELTLAIQQGLKLGAMADLIHAYPTRSAMLGQAAVAYQKTRLTPFARWFLDWVLRLPH